MDRNLKSSLAGKYQQRPIKYSLAYHSLLRNNSKARYQLQQTSQLTCQFFPYSFSYKRLCLYKDSEINKSSAWFIHKHPTYFSRRNRHTPKTASRIMFLLILLSPSTRSVNIMGTSFKENPRSFALYFISI